MTSEFPETTAEEVYFIIMHINLLKIFVAVYNLEKQTAQILAEINILSCLLSYNIN